MTHPPTSERIALLKKEMDILSSENPGVLKRSIRRKEFIRLLEGMAVGQWNGREVVIGDRYYNKEFLLTIPIPEGWQVQINSEDYTAIFFDAKKESLAYFDVQALRKRKTTKEYFDELSGLIEKKGLNNSPDSLNRAESLSHGALAGIFKGRSSGLGSVKAQLIAFTREDSGFSILGLGKLESFEELQPLFESMINGMSFISQQEASKISPPRMRIHTVSAGDTWDSITSRYFKSSKEKDKLAEYNGLKVENDPAPGLLLKIPPSLRFS